MSPDIMKLDKLQIARVLEEIGVILELKGENPFKVRAYINAARTLEQLEDDLNELIESGKLTEIRGIGKNLAEHIVELHNTGRLKEYEKLRKSIPDGVIEMLNIQGVGPKKVKVIWETYGIDTVDELELICRQGRVAVLPGFGKKTEEKILQGIQFMRRFRGRFLFCDAQAVALTLLDKIEHHRNTIRCEIAGSIRRRKEIVGDIDILVSSKKPEPLMDLFTKHPLVEAVTAKGSTKSSVVLKTGMNADLRVVSDEEFPFALHYFTGCKEHNVAMRARAKKRGLKLSEYGLFKGTKPTKCRDEADIFKALDLAYIEPEMREDTGEMKLAEKNKLPKLVELGDLKGILHVHSNYSDGIASIDEMARAAKSMGMTYIGMADHSQSVTYAGGLTPAEVKKQHAEIDKLNKKLKGFHIFKGIECDILKDGKLDYPDSVLRNFDFVIASIHSNFTMSEKEMTARICKGISNPRVNMLAHPTGRLLLAREGYKVDLNKVIECAAKHGVDIEINANPNRLDLDWRYCKHAKEMGLKMPINPDSHQPAGLGDIAYGVGIARKGWLEKGDVLNTMSAEELKRYWGKKK